MLQRPAVILIGIPCCLALTCAPSSTDTARPIAAATGDRPPDERRVEARTVPAHSADGESDAEVAGEGDSAVSRRAREAELRTHVDDLLGDDSAKVDSATDALVAAGAEAVPYLVEALARAAPGSEARTRILDVATDLEHPARGDVLAAAAKDPEDLDAPVRLVLGGHPRDIMVALKHPAMPRIVAKLNRSPDGRATRDDMVTAIADRWSILHKLLVDVHASAHGPFKKLLSHAIAKAKARIRPAEKRPGPGGGEGWGPHPPPKGWPDDKP